MTRVRPLRLPAAFLGVMMLAACASDAPELQYVERDAELLYGTGMDMLERGRYQLAAQIFDEVERQHPYSSWARRAELMSAYSHYQYNNYDEAILAAERFLGLHPGNQNAPYAFYLIAVCHYEQIADVGRDQKQTQMALQALEDVIRRYPDTEYARDARLKRDLTLDHLAGKEMEIGRFYQTQGHHLAAIRRFRAVIEEYETTSHTPEALHRLVESYLVLGVDEEAEVAGAVLGYNFPGSEWYRDSYALLDEQGLEPTQEPPSWIERAFAALF